jgi:hypothetical protein
MKGNSENTWNEMIYAQNGKKKKKVEISLKSREKHTHLDSKPIFEKKKSVQVAARRKRWIYIQRVRV